MSTLVAQLNQNNAMLAEENSELKEQLAAVLAEQKATGEVQTDEQPQTVAGGSEELAAANAQLAEDNQQLWEQFQTSHSRVRDDMNDLISELNSYKIRLL